MTFPIFTFEFKFGRSQFKVRIWLQPDCTFSVRISEPSPWPHFIPHGSKEHLNDRAVISTKKGVCHLERH